MIPFRIGWAVVGSAYCRQPGTAATTGAYRFALDGALSAADAAAAREGGHYKRIAVGWAGMVTGFASSGQPEAATFPSGEGIFAHHRQVGKMVDNTNRPCIIA